MRHLLLALTLLLTGVPAAQAQVSISIGIHLPVYPEFRRVPGYPVYYAPNAPGNYFFYDGLYWVFESDNWYASDWYNGPWQMIDPYSVPLFVLRVPVRRLYQYRWHLVAATLLLLLAVLIPGIGREVIAAARAVMEQSAKTLPIMSSP